MRASGASFGPKAEDRRQRDDDRECRHQRRTRESIRSRQRRRGGGCRCDARVVPPYVKPTQGGMLDAILARSPTRRRCRSSSIISRAEPARTCCRRRCSTCQAPQAISPASKSRAAISSRSRRLCAIGRNDFMVWSGDDHLFLPYLALGADGVVGVASHLCSREYRAMVDAYPRGDVGEAARFTTASSTLRCALYHDESDSDQVGDESELGFKAGRCRLPLDRLPSALANVCDRSLRRMRTHGVAGH